MAVALTLALAVGSTLLGASSAQAWDNGQPGHPDQQQTLAPNTHFTMAADGSSGATVGGENIPNIDSVKKTIARYYGDPGTGIANKTTSPYINEMASITSRAASQLQAGYDRAISQGQKPAIVFDSDDTTLMTYDMEVADMHFTFNPAEQDIWVQAQRFPATPSMVSFVNTAAAMGYTIFGLTGRNDDQKAATLGNLTKDGYTAFSSNNFFTKWTGAGASQQPSYITCAAAKCTTSSSRPSPASTSRISATRSPSTWATSGPTCRVALPSAS